MNADLGLIFLLIITIIIGWLLGYREATRKRFTRTQDYLRNWFGDENDGMSKATLSQLSNVLDFDDESVETFLALGAMYRKQGNITKAIELHEMLAESQVLSEENRQLARLELGKDYAVSGIQDRAETAFISCKQSTYGHIRRMALRELLTIYKKQRDWTAATQTVSTLLTLESGDTTNAAAAVHYLCEQATLALSEGDTTELKRTFKAIDKLPVKDSEHYHRVALLKIADALANQKVDDANAQAISLLQQEPLLISRLVETLGAARTEAFTDAVTSLAGTLDGAAEKRQELYLLKLAQVLPEQFAELPDDLKARVAPLMAQGVRPSYVCHQCGFKTSVFTWDCSSCMGWYTLKPSFSALR